MSDWQPMETSPKTGYQRVLLLFSGGEVSVGYWDAYYAESGRGYVLGGTAWIEPCSAERLDLHYDPPVAWMPLPERPPSPTPPSE